MTPFLAIAAGLSALATPAGASGSGAAPAAVIRYDDLDLTSSAGQRILKSRVSAAERATCSVGPITGSHLEAADPECKLSFRRAVDAQVKAAIAKAEGRRANGPTSATQATAGASQ